ncbi:EH signature domain-containing protein [Eilatimonas milleporae]|uniref:EH signature protein n=1 Tax=Eilatimonas milleporae TaxID=911205 RepID=A0A3M0CWF4_9PROT|nr:EH signature domain-containing protein [Eilatimonas milleporae]RMB08083.1 EH signature protein [Eilatimonas milleporae]
MMPPNGLNVVIDRLKTVGAALSRFDLQTCAVKDAVADLGTVIAEGGTPQPEDLEARATRLIAAFKTDKGFSVLSRPDIRNAFSALFNGTPNPAEISGLTDDLIERARVLLSASIVRAMVSTYLQNFSHRSPAIQSLRSALADIPERYRPHGLDPLFDSRFFAQDGPERAARMLRESHISPQDRLRELGLNSVFQSSPFTGAVFESYCRDISITGGRAELALDRLLNWAWVDGQEAFPRQRPALAGALFAPYTDVPADPSIKRKLLDFVLKAWGDPRFRSARGAWHFIDPVIINTVQRWLTEASVDQFLDIVDQDAQEHMWQYRRVFWTAYLRKGYISGAWVVFGRDGVSRAHKSFTETNDKSFKNHARFHPRSQPQDRRQSVLLMDFGSLVVAEWSHNGSLRVWRKSDQAAPELYKPEYQASLLRQAQWQKPHQGADRYRWQQWAANLIREETGIRLTQIEYTLGQYK